MIQPLHQILQNTFIASPQTITFVFPTVPQGLRWTGSITISTLGGGDPQLVQWTLYRNGTPCAAGWEFPVFMDVQAVGQETMKLVGTYEGPAASIPTYQFTATWDGYSGEMHEIPVCIPSVVNSTRGRVHIYNTLGMDGPLEISPAASAVNRAHTTLGGAGLTAPILPNAAIGYSLWEIQLQATAGQLAATAGVKWLTATVQTNEVTPRTLLRVQLTTLPGTAASESANIPLHGWTLPAGVGMQIVTAAYTGDNANAECTIVYTGS